MLSIALKWLCCSRMYELLASQLERWMVIIENNWNLAPELTAYTLTQSFSHASHKSSHDSLSSIAVDMATGGPQCCDHLGPCLEVHKPAILRWIVVLLSLWALSVRKCLQASVYLCTTPQVKPQGGVLSTHQLANTQWQVNNVNHNLRYSTL